MLRASGQRTCAARAQSLMASISSIAPFLPKPSEERAPESRQSLPTPRMGSGGTTSGD